MRIRTILAAAAAPLAIGSVLLTTTAASASTGSGNSDAISAYYWQPNGHALGGPQPDPASFNNPSGLALVDENMHGQNINGETITITGTLTPGAVNAYSGDVNAYARIWFDGAGGSSEQSPQGYLGQVWWNHATLDVNKFAGTFTVTAVVSPTSDWSDWNGKSADQNQALFQQAASHVQKMGLSFGGQSFFEDGVTGSGGITVTSISASQA
jgi:hypothetical protein